LKQSTSSNSPTAQSISLQLKSFFFSCKDQKMFWLQKIQAEQSMQKVKASLMSKPGPWDHQQPTIQFQHSLMLKIILDHMLNWETKACVGFQSDTHLFLLLMLCR